MALTTATRPMVFAIRSAISGTLDQELPTMHVDSFGADPSGLTDSTPAFVLAQTALSNVITTSALGSRKFIQAGRIMFGNGRYRLENATILCGMMYSGLGGFSTAIIPNRDGVWCFKTVGTQDYTTGREDARMFRACFKDMTIGGGFQRKFDDIPLPTLGHGIFIQHASYVTMHDVYFRHLGGHGLNMESIWDSEFYNTRFMYVGTETNASTAYWALSLSPGSDAEDGSNACRFYGTHIEGCPAMLFMGKRSRHIFFIGGKFESIRYNDGNLFRSCILRGCNGVVFSDMELSWSNIIRPMFLIEGTTVDVEGVESDHSVGVQFLNPSIIDSVALSGDYFRYTSKRGPLLLLGGSARNARYILANCDNIIWSDMTLSYCGPKLSVTTGNVTIKDLVVNYHRMESNLKVFTFTGVNNKMFNCYLESSNGAVDNGNSWVFTNVSSELEIDGLTIHGRMQNVVEGISTTWARKCRRIRILSDASVGSVIKDGYQSEFLPYELRGPTPWGVVERKTLATDATTTFSAVLGAATTVTVSARKVGGGRVHNAVLLADVSSFSTVVMAGTDIFVSDGTTGVPANGKIHVTKSGGDLLFTSRITDNTFDLYIKAESLI